jgi:ligand-binding sensor domain-containing protein
MALAGVCLGASVPAYHDEWKLSQLSRRAWQIEDGLPHNYVTAIATDEKGYLLVATSSGIARFDGMRFAPFEHFGGMRIVSLLRASDGALWVGGCESGLHVLRGGKIQSWYEADGIGKNTVYSLLEDRSHRIWAVAHNGLLLMDRGRPRLIAPEVDVERPGGQSVTEDQSGSIWFAAKAGLFRITGGKAKIVRLSGTGGWPLTIDYSSAVDQLVLGTTTGIYQLKCLSDTCESVKTPEVAGPVVGIRVVADGTVWVATWGHGVFRYKGTRVEQISTHDGLADDFVRVLHEDAEKNLWVGTRSGGLTRFRRTILKPIGIPEGLGGNYASAVLGDGAGGLWLGTWRSGLFHWRNGVVSAQPLPQRPLDSLITALALDSAHDLWVGSFHGLWRVHERDNAAERVALPGGDGVVTSLVTAHFGSPNRVPD